MPDSQTWLSLFYSVTLEMVWSHEEEGGGAICTESDRCPILEWKDLGTSMPLVQTHMWEDEKERKKKGINVMPVHLQEKARKDTWKNM